MIRVNLIGGPKQQAAKKGFSIPLPTSLLPVVWIGLFIGIGAYGYFWWDGLVQASAGLSSQISSAQAQKAQLQTIIDQDAVFEARKTMLEDRISVIQDLQRNQVSPVLSLDSLSQAIQSIEYIWLSQLTQNNSNFSMAGTATSVNAVADFVENLEQTGYFRNVNLGTLQAGQGNFSFNLTCEFLPPALPGEVPDEAGDGVN